jgi:predicted permease
MMFTFFVTIFCYGWGLSILIPKEAGGSVAMGLKKGLLSPPMIAIFLGMAGGLLGVYKYLPAFLNNAMSSASACMGPVAMLLAGMVIGNYEFKKMFTDIKIYVASFLRLIVIPSAVVIALKLLGTNDEIVSLAFIAFATPLGLNTIVYPSAYGGDPSTGASMATVSHTLSVITIPIMYLLLIVLL